MIVFSKLALLSMALLLKLFLVSGLALVMISCVVFLLIGPVAYYTQKVVIQINQQVICDSIEEPAQDIEIITEETNLVKSKIYNSKPVLRMLTLEQYMNLFVYNQNTSFKWYPILVFTRGFIKDMSMLRVIFREFKYRDIKNNKTLKAFQHSTPANVKKTLPLVNSMESTPAPIAQKPDSSVKRLKLENKQKESKLAKNIKARFAIWNIFSGSAFSGTAFTNEGSQGKENEKEECIICLDYFKDSDNVIVLPCKHYYHTSCIESCTRNVCPTCQFSVNGVKWR